VKHWADEEIERYRRDLFYGWMPPVIGLIAVFAIMALIAVVGK
jgi:hypothetical protein